MNWTSAVSVTHLPFTFPLVTTFGCLLRTIPLHLSVPCFEWGETHPKYMCLWPLSMEHHNHKTTIGLGQTCARNAGKGTDVLSQWTWIQVGARLEVLEPSYNQTEGAYLRQEPAKEKAEPRQGERMKPDVCFKPLREATPEGDTALCTFQLCELKKLKIHFKLSQLGWIFSYLQLKYSWLSLEGLPSNESTQKQISLGWLWYSGKYCSRGSRGEKNQAMSTALQASRLP